MSAVVIVSSLAAGGLIGLLVGIYMVADTVVTRRSGCLACGRPWHDHERGHVERAALVRIIPPAEIDQDLDPDVDQERTEP